MASTAFPVRAICAIWVSVALAASAAANARDRNVPRQFQKIHPCPATGQPTGPCPGWIIDHRIPLCAGGADAIANLQWQARAEAIDKDDAERRLCRRKKYSFAY